MCVYEFGEVSAFSLRADTHTCKHANMHAHVQACARARSRNHFDSKWERHHNRANSSSHNLCTKNGPKACVSSQEALGQEVALDQ